MEQRTFFLQIFFLETSAFIDLEAVYCMVGQYKTSSTTLSCFFDSSCAGTARQYVLVGFLGFVGTRLE